MIQKAGGVEAHGISWSSHTPSLNIMLPACQCKHTTLAEHHVARVSV
jgi:hypothetical protein